MALTLHSTQSSLNRPTRPKDPNGISRAVRSGGTGAQTKADRAATKAAYVTWSTAWKTTFKSSGDHSTEFTEAGSGITYADD
jgi:hypothetical protein